MTLSDILLHLTGFSQGRSWQWILLWALNISFLGRKHYYTRDRRRWFSETKKCDTQVLLSSPSFRRLFQRQAWWESSSGWSGIIQVFDIALRQRALMCYVVQAKSRFWLSMWLKDLHHVTRPLHSVSSLLNCYEQARRQTEDFTFQDYPQASSSWRSDTKALNTLFTNPWCSELVNLRFIRENKILKPMIAVMKRVNKIMKPGYPSDCWGKLFTLFNKESQAWGCLHEDCLLRSLNGRVELQPEHEKHVPNRENGWYWRRIRE
jgi:hypothetical protein